MSFGRPAGWALVVGTVVAFAGYAAANLLAPGAGDNVYQYGAWPLLEGIALVGDVVMAMGLPAILLFAGRARVLHLVGYAGIVTALVALNVGEGVVEAFVKPYLVDHGGIPAGDLAGLPAFEGFGLLGLVVGSIAWGIGILRARVLPWWVGVVVLASALVGALGLPGAWFLVPDGLFYSMLFLVGVRAIRGHTPRSATSDAPVALASARG